MKLAGLQVLLTLAATALGVENSKVLTLSSENFTNYISSHDYVLAEFYAPWCGHCKSLAPEYEAAAASLSERPEDIILAKIDCTDNHELCTGHEVRGFPTLYLFEKGEKAAQYNGGRKADDIANYLIKRSQPAVIDVKTASDFQSWLDKNLKANPVTFAFFGKDADIDAFSKLASKNRDRLTFVSVANSDDLVKKYGGEVVVFRDDEDHVPMTSKSIDSESLEKFVNSHSFPTFGEIGPSTFLAYVESKTPMLYAFVEDDESRELVKSSLKPHLKDLSGKVNIVFLDATLYPMHAENVNLRNEFPAMVVHDIVAEKKYVHSQDIPLSEKSIGEFVTNYLAGKIEPTVKSAPVPETQDEPVYVLVGSEFERVVLESDKDVLVEFYAPWCGHCKTLKPKYDELGELFDGNDDVLIAKLDHTANEVPVSITGYPTIMLFPAGKKDSPIEYDGSRDVKSLAKFIENNGTKKATPNEKAKKASNDVKKEL